MATLKRNSALQPTEALTPAESAKPASSHGSIRLSPSEIESLRQNFTEVDRQVQEILASRRSSWHSHEPNHAHRHPGRGIQSPPCWRRACCFKAHGSLIQKQSDIRPYFERLLQKAKSHR